MRTLRFLLLLILTGASLSIPGAEQGQPALAQAANNQYYEDDNDCGPMEFCDFGQCVILYNLKR